MPCQTLDVSLAQDARPQSDGVCRSYEFGVFIVTFAGEPFATFAGNNLSPFE